MNEKRTPIRVMVVDDHLVVREGFGVLLKAFSDLAWVGEAENGREAIRLCATLKPDVILMDMVMPEVDGVEATRQIRQHDADIQVIALTSFTDDKQLVQAALEAGAIGYLFKNISAQDLVQAVRSAYEGKSILAPEVMRMLIQAKTERTAQDFKLSERELAVLALLVEGLNNREIAERLSITLSTTKFHVSSIFAKLGAGSRSEAVALAYQHKLVK